MHLSTLSTGKIEIQEEGREEKLYSYGKLEVPEQLTFQELLECLEQPGCLEQPELPEQPECPEQQECQEQLRWQVLEQMVHQHQHRQRILD